MKKQITLLTVIVSLLVGITTLKAEIKIFEIKSVANATDCNGSIAILIDGNSGPYNVSASLKGKSIGTPFTNVGNGLYTFSNLCVGDYEILVTDNNIIASGSLSSCEKKLTASIVVCEPFFINIVDKSKIVCDGANDGYVDIEVDKGTPPYKYLWSNGSTTQDINNLPGDRVYSVTVTDANGCKAEKKDILIEGQKIRVECKGVNDFGSCTGSASILSVIDIPNMTISDYSVVWSNGSTDKTINNICKGSYSVIVTSSAGCTGIGNINILDCPPKKLSLLIGTGNFCEQSGKVYVEITGGIEPYNLNVEEVSKSVGGSNSIDIFTGSVKSYGYVDIPQRKENNTDYILKVTDACGYSTSKTLSCNCSSNDIDDIMTDLELLRSYYSLPKRNYCGIGSGEKAGIEIEFWPTRVEDYIEVKTKKFYTLFWPDGTTSEIRLYPGFAHTEIVGKKFFEVTKHGAYEFKIVSNMGCEFKFCADFGGPSKTCFSYPVEKQIKDIAPPNILKDMPSVTQLSEAYFGDKKTEACVNLGSKCDPKTYDIGLGTTHIPTTPFKYTPFDKTRPCDAGLLQYGCGSVKVFGGVDFCDDDALKSDPKKCQVDCGCLFPAGFINVYPYNYKEIFVMTKKITVPIPAECENQNNPTTPDPDDEKELEDIKQKCTRVDPYPDCPGAQRPILDPQSPYEDCKYDIKCVKTGELMSKACSRKWECVTERALTQPECKADSDGKIPKCDLIWFCPYPFPSLSLSANHTVKIIQECVDCNAISYKNCSDYKKGFVGDDDESTARTMKSQIVKKGEPYAIVFPNPFENQLNILVENNKSKLITFKLIDVFGRTHQIENTKIEKEENNFLFDIDNNLPSGIYYLQIIGEDYKLQYSVVKQ
jgi:Secretion system C-terminal sorting domain/SprB repeat